MLSREILTGIALPSLLGALYASFNFILLFYYSQSQAVVEILLSAAVAASISCAILFQIRLKKDNTESMDTSQDSFSRY